jgi:predicted pyridoxine 5'-phosphate oxidase superfamily flavin-nucleotide-binding protein
LEPFPRLARSLSRAKVRFVVIGVSGVNHYAQTAGLVFATQDRDLFLPLDPDNALRAWQTCRDEGLELWCNDEPLGKPMDRILAEQVISRRALVRAEGQGCWSISRS